MFDDQRQRKPFAQLAAVRGVGVRLDTAHVMVDVSRVYGAADIGETLVKQAEQRDRVGPTRERNQDGLPDQVREELAKSG